MIQSKQDLDAWYEKQDPWGYEEHTDDQYRRDMILDAIHPFAPFKRALDIGAGEGFISKELPAQTIEAIEISDVAAKRLPARVKRVKKPDAKYDLIVVSGMLYKQYDHEQFIKWIKEHAGGVVVTCNIKDWEINPLPTDKQIHYVEFPYRTYTQALRVYQWVQ